jgi:hypothetical protein
MVRWIVLGACAVSFSAWAAPARILHQTQGSVIVRIAADDEVLVWQEVGGFSKRALGVVDLKTGAKRELRSPDRPFGPSLEGGHVLFASGDASKKVDVFLATGAGKAVRLDRDIPYIVEPAVQSLGGGKLRAFWERSENLDGNGLKIVMYESDAKARGQTRVLVEGPIFLREEIPVEYHRFVKSEYPEVSGQSLAFQNTENGAPNVYRYEIDTNVFTRVSPSARHQERPAIAGPYVAWEESELGFAVSEISELWMQDSRTGQAKRVSREPGFHYQVRAYGEYLVYGAKREPAPNTPSIRIYDIALGKEIAAEKCFTGSVFDWSATAKGVYAAQRVTPESSRLLFATWEQLKAGCPASS